MIGHPDPERATILVVDDTPGLARILTRVLLIAGYERAEGVESARTAWHRVMAAPVDLLIADVTLALGDLFPDGCALAQAVADRHPDTRFLFLSGYDRADLTHVCPPDAPLVIKPPMGVVFLARVADVLASPPWVPRADWRERV